MSDFNIIELHDSSKWNEIVTSFQQYDVYYLSNYVKAFQIHGDGKPLLMDYETKELRGISVSMKRDISQFAPFKGIIAPDTYFDIATPYGYGGFLFEGDTSESAIKRFYESYAEFLKSHHLISRFVRFHPQLNNANSMRLVTPIIDLGKTISMDLQSKEIIWENISCSCRNQIRRSEESGVEIHHGKSLELLSEFRTIYNATMAQDNADSYYYFEKEFYESIHTDLHDNYEVFYAVLEGEKIAMAIMLYANNRMHCHLCGSLYQYRHLAPTNLLFLEAALWGNKQGFKTLHLGGGLGSEEDSLFRFKKTFNRKSDNTFSVGKEIFDQEVYDQLVEIRKKSDPSFDSNSSFFPLYRA